MAAAAKLQDPDFRGLAGTIALTQLKRAVKKIGFTPPELSHLTPGRLEELRQANLIASADIALAKLRDPARDIQNRFEQLAHLEHYIQKADCGWQTVGLSERELIALQFCLHCERIIQKSEDHHALRHWHREAERFLYKVDREDSLPADEYATYAQKLALIVQEKKQELEESSYAFAEKGLDALRNTSMSSNDALDLAKEIRKSLHASQRQGREIRKMLQELEEFQETAQKQNYKEQYEEILASGKGAEAVSAIEKIEQEMDYNQWSWSDIGLDDDEVKKAKAVFDYDGLVQDMAEGKAFLEKGDVTKAFWKVCAADTILSTHDFDSIGRNTTEISAFYRQVLKLNLSNAFEKALDPACNGLAAVNELETIEAKLRENKMGWGDIAPDRDQNILAENISSIYCRAADQEAEIYLLSKHQGHLSAVGWYLNKAGKGWDAVGRFEDVKAIAAAAKHEFPDLQAQ